jgi:hypothetical protein
MAHYVLHSIFQINQHLPPYIIQQLIDSLGPKSAPPLLLKRARTYPMWPSLANQEQRSMFHIGTIIPPHHFQTLLEILRTRSRHIPATQRKHHPAKHHKVFLLMQRKVGELRLMRIMYHHLNNPTRAYADPNGKPQEKRITISHLTLGKIQGKERKTHRFCPVNKTLETSTIRTAWPAS